MIDAFQAAYPGGQRSVPSDQTVLTTEKYYVGIKAQETAQHLRELMADEQRRQRPLPKPPSFEPEQNSKTPTH